MVLVSKINAGLFCRMGHGAALEGLLPSAAGWMGQVHRRTWGQGMLY